MWLTVIKQLYRLGNLASHYMSITLSKKPHLQGWLWCWLSLTCSYTVWEMTHFVCQYLAQHILFMKQTHYKLNSWRTNIVTCFSICQVKYTKNNSSNISLIIKMWELLPENSLHNETWDLHWKYFCKVNYCVVVLLNLTSMKVVHMFKYKWTGKKESQ